MHLQLSQWAEILPLGITAPICHGDKIEKSSHLAIVCNTLKHLVLAPVASLGIDTNYDFMIKIDVAKGPELMASLSSFPKSQILDFDLQDIARPSQDI